jgi:hypothetical protein
MSCLKATVEIKRILVVFFALVSIACFSSVHLSDSILRVAQILNRNQIVLFALFCLSDSMSQELWRHVE